MDPPSEKPKSSIDGQASTSKTNSDQSSKSDIPSGEQVGIENPLETFSSGETFKKDGMSRSFHGVVYQLKLIILFMKLGANKKYKSSISMTNLKKSLQTF
jgi:hypothetical protein